MSLSELRIEGGTPFAIGFYHKRLLQTSFKATAFQLVDPICKAGDLAF